MARVYHPGERSVQERAGVREMADRIGRSVGTTIPPTAWNFLRSQPLVVVGSVDTGRRVWASLVTGTPGLVQAIDENTVRINAQPAAGDPLGDNLAANDAVGLIAIEFATRRRMRLNGKAESRKGRSNHCSRAAGVLQLPEVHSSTQVARTTACS